MERRSAGYLPSGAAVFAFDNTYARDLEGTYVPWRPAPPSRPALVVLNEPLAEELDLEVERLRTEGARLLSGADVPEGASPLAQAYAGHQFGGLSPQLGDGRALLLGELVDREGRRRDLQLKGSGRTPFSRGGDGRATLAPMLREHVIGEALHALGIPTSRALAVTTTGDVVPRERRLPGAVLARVAASHLRIGTFEFFALRDDRAQLERLVAYALRRHHPRAEAETPALALLGAVRDAQASLVARWMGVGFVHGVLNTDNVTISGESLDFGPCAFLDAHDPATVFSSIDARGRYAFGEQPAVTAWNLARLASALLPVLHPDEGRAVALAEEALEAWDDRFRAAWLRELRTRTGLDDPQPDDAALLDPLPGLLRDLRPDHTRFFRALAPAAVGDDAPLRAAVTDPARLAGPAGERLDGWLARWRARLGPGAAATADRLRSVNPRVIPRNHRVEEALDAAVLGDLEPYRRLVAAVRRPFDDDPALATWDEPAPPAFASSYRTFCGT